MGVLHLRDSWCSSVYCSQQSCRNKAHLTSPQSFSNSLGHSPFADISPTQLAWEMPRPEYHFPFAAALSLCLAYFQVLKSTLWWHHLVKPCREHLLLSAFMLILSKGLSRRPSICIDPESWNSCYTSNPEVTAIKNLQKQVHHTLTLLFSFLSCKEIQARLLVICLAYHKTHVVWNVFFRN